MSARGGLVLGGARELGTVGLVAGLCGAYAAVLLMVSSFLSTVADEAGGGLAIALNSVTTVFVGIALYVASVVIANAVSVVLAGRLRHIALLRLLGGEARDLRRSVRDLTAGVGLVGALIGTVLGVVGSAVMRLLLVHRGTMPEADYALWRPALLAAVGAIALTSLLAGWTGSRAVLSVSPAQALSGAAAESQPPKRESRRRTALALLMILGGAGTLALAMWMGERGSAAGFFVAFMGAVVSGTGLLIGARLVIPSAVAVFASTLGRTPTARIARRNARKDPQRTTRSTMGLVIGVTLVTTLASGFAALRTAVHSVRVSPQVAAEIDHALTMMAAIMIGIVLMSSVIAAVGFASTMSLTVIQRRREIGLLRAMGFTTDQVRAMITLESVALSATAVLIGVALGIVYGSAGSQSLVGSLTDGFFWGLPWAWLAAIALAGALLVFVTSQLAARRAVAQSPIEALAQEN